ncbi:succinylglutamate desuccinylase/aspartoacylase family protein [Gemmobacter fulvus]|uniref:Succinylglutamate desuccinylase/aspartoacylase family protein n=1 Tax=Gemmobacter fulvus TaxID=2840474 RepID=A0A975S0U7_9RHOB|nr:succinylglutamate desuccinylase/aspartoacylase family protein [Gemmobacter fulvus]MBT9245898.1 succinylglutamate desuccinylase/aspartoacylase family protein [Gemmobacter fulvus]QWK89273.1 succinylglutamate desuccinylase/aspartoacylase family protein [Gemmobacter fulvus]
MSDLCFAAAPAPEIGPDLTITVRAGQDAAAPHRGTLTIGDWTVPCAVGRSGIVDPALKREGDGATPAGRFALRYGFYEPGVFADAEMAAMAFPFKPKPDSYDWIENPASPDYNRMRARSHNEPPPERAPKLFDIFIPLGWNDAAVHAAAGSAIFLHAARPEMTGTAGCVAVPHDELLNLARRLRPGMIVDIATPTDATAPLATPDTMESVTFHSLRPGPRVIVTGAVHGNEVCGPKAITRMIAEFRAGRRKLLCGSVTFLPVVNAMAYRLDRREGDRNLNRALRDYPVPMVNEDHVANVLCPMLRAHDVLIDLHSFAAEGPAFALFGPEGSGSALEPRAQPATELALIEAIGLPFAVHGWMPAHLTALAHQGRTDQISHAVGTTEFMRFAGGAAITVECGPHKDPASVEVAYSVIARGLAALGLIAQEAGPPPAKPLILEIGEAIFAESDADSLIRAFPTGAPVRAGEVIGHRATGAEILAPHDGSVIFASGKVRAGTELCFLCRPSSIGAAP